MIYYKTKDEIELMRISALLVSQTLAEVAKELKPGMTTMQLDAFIEKFIRDNGAVPNFKNYGPKGHEFPYSACISLNDAVVHGFPSNTEIKDGDIISVDVGVFKNGFHGDSAYTFAVGNVKEDVLQLLRVTKESLDLGVQQAVANNRIGDIGWAIQEHTERKHKYGVVRDLVGHGLGRHLHEDPQVPNYGKRGNGLKLQAGLVIAIEPMINMGTKDVYTDKDGWTIRTRDGKPSAHFEHDVCVQKGAADVLSSFVDIEAAEKANPELAFAY